MKAATNSDVAAMGDDGSVLSNDVAAMNVDVSCDVGCEGAGIGQRAVQVNPGVGY